VIEALTGQSSVSSLLCKGREALVSAHEQSVKLKGVRKRTLCGERILGIGVEAADFCDLRPRPGCFACTPLLLK
jgi:hypothetical protein